MGLLRENKVLLWEDIVKRKDEIKRKGIKQFVDAYGLYKDAHVPHIAFGDELELIMAGKEDKKWKLILGSKDVISSLDMSGLNLEYANYMLEISAKAPYGPESYLNVEEEILKKVSVLTEYMKREHEDGHVFMLSVFPNFAERFFSKRLINGSLVQKFSYDITKSDVFPDEGIADHDRFRAFTQNIRNRRGKKIEGYVRVVKDPDASNQGADEDYVKIDSMGQGMGYCCLQTTIQASNLDEGRLIYDMLGVFCPILLRMTAGSPVAQGKVLSTETRWEMLCMSVDCRTSAERGNEFDVSGFPTRERPPTATIFKSRFSSIDFFISNYKTNLSDYNDLFPPIEKASYDGLVENKVDERMAKHIASLFVRDPILSYEAVDEDHRDDFENIQSSNWRSMRLKLPDKDVKDAHSGFKVETRVMEIQATAFENAAFIYFNFLLSRIVVEYRCNFYIPLSLVDENFMRANLFIRSKEEYFCKFSEDRQKFYYRANIFDEDPPIIKEGTVCEILNGNEEFCGIICMIRRIIRERFEDNRKLHAYIDFIEKKSKGSFMTLSDWIRRFIFKHRSYKNDSNVNDDIVNDLLDELRMISIENKVEYLSNE